MKYLCPSFSSQIEHKATLLRDDVIEANFYSGTLADSYGMDVLDLHYHFRSSLQHRTSDGVHWNALAHRWITCLLLKHIAQAWGVGLPLEENKVVSGKCILVLRFRNDNDFKSKSRSSCSLPMAAMLVLTLVYFRPRVSGSDRRQFEGSRKNWKRQKYLYQENRYGPTLPQPLFNGQHGGGKFDPRRTVFVLSIFSLLKSFKCPLDFSYWPSFHIDPYMEHRHNGHHSYVLRHRHIRPHNTPYTLYTQRQYNCYHPYWQHGFIKRKLFAFLIHLLLYSLLVTCKKPV